jgi:hypothetical protein
MQHDNVHKQKGYIEEPEYDVGDFTGCSSDVPDSEEEKQGKRQKQAGNAGQNQSVPPAERNEHHQSAACGCRPNLNCAFRKGHAVEFVYSYETENGQQTGRWQRATFDDGQDDNRQKDKSGNQTFDD